MPDDCRIRPCDPAHPMYPLPRGIVREELTNLEEEDEENDFATRAVQARIMIGLRAKRIGQVTDNSLRVVLMAEMAGLVLMYEQLTGKALNIIAGTGGNDNEDR